MTTEPHMHHHHEPLAELLDLDALVLSGFLTDVMTWVNDRTVRPARRILDVGAGTGTGTVALAERFPDARVVAADLSAPMLQRVRERAASHGLGDRVSTVQVNLDGPWAELGSFDIAWASAALHELTDPDSVFESIFGALNLDGLAAIIEMDAPPRFLEATVGDGLEERIHDALRDVRADQNDHPDWSDNLERAGFAAVERQAFSIDMTFDAEGIGGRYAQAYLRRVQPFVASRLSTPDRTLLDLLLANDGPQSLRVRDDLHLRAGRTVWAAHRP